MRIAMYVVLEGNTTGPQLFIIGEACKSFSVSSGLLLILFIGTQDPGSRKSGSCSVYMAT